MMQRNTAIENDIHTLQSSRQKTAQDLSCAKAELSKLHEQLQETKKKKHKKALKQAIDAKSSQIEALTTLERNNKIAISAITRAMRSAETAIADADMARHKQNVLNRFPAPYSSVAFTEILALDTSPESFQVAADKLPLADLWATYLMIKNSIDTTTALIKIASAADRKALLAAVEKEGVLAHRLVNYTNTKHPDANLSFFMTAPAEADQTASTDQLHYFNTTMSKEAFHQQANKLTEEQVSDLADNLRQRTRTAEDCFRCSISAAQNDTLKQQILLIRNEQKVMATMLREFRALKLEEERKVLEKTATDAHTALQTCITALNANENLTPEMKKLVEAAQLVADTNQYNYNQTYKAEICSATKKVLESDTPEVFLANLENFQAVAKQNTHGRKANYQPTILAACGVFLSAAAIIAGIVLAATLIMLPIGVGLIVFGSLGLLATCPLTAIEAEFAKSTGNELALPKFQQCANSLKQGFFAPKAIPANEPDVALTAVPALN